MTQFKQNREEIVAIFLCLSYLGVTWRSVVTQNKKQRICVSNTEGYLHTTNEATELLVTKFSYFIDFANLYQYFSSIFCAMWIL